MNTMQANLEFLACDVSTVFLTSHTLHGQYQSLQTDSQALSANFRQVRNYIDFLAKKLSIAENEIENWRTKSSLEPDEKRAFVLEYIDARNLWPDITEAYNKRFPEVQSTAETLRAVHMASKPNCGKERLRPEDANILINPER